METWKILLITLLSAVLLGCISGVIIGKIQVRRMRSRRGPIFSRKETVLLLAVALVGIGCVLFGVFYLPSQELDPGFAGPDGMVMNPGDMGADGSDAMPPDGDALLLNEEEGEAVNGEVAEGEIADGEAVDGEESDEDDAADEPAVADGTGTQSVTVTPRATPHTAPRASARGGNAVAVYRAN